MSDPLVEIGIAFAALALVGYAATRISLSVIPAYIVAGIVVGPHAPTSLFGVSLTLVPESTYVDLLAELGVLLLLFFLGLEFSVAQLLADRRRIATAGTVDLVLNFGAGVALGLAFGRTPLETLFIAGVVYISSSAIVTKSLLEQGWIANPESEPILGTLVFEDVVIAGYLAVLAALATGGGDVAAVATDVGIAFAFLGALAIAARFGPPLLESAFDVESEEVFVLGALALTTVVGALALAGGLSEAVAAFFVGAAFNRTDHVERLERALSPVRDVFAAVFFFAVGLSIDVTVLTGVVGLLATAVAVTTATKLVSGAMSGRVFGLDPVRSLRTGIGLVPRGEFSLVLAALALQTGGPVADIVPSFAVGYVLLMSLLGTVMIQFADVVTDAFAPLIPGAE